MSIPYNPKEYWERRLSSRFSLRGVGHISYSESYNTWLYRRKKRCIEACFANTTLKGKRVLDVGCGTGFFIEWYLQRGAKVCGVDITDVSIERLKQRYSCELYTQDISAPDYRPHGEFDVVNMWDVIYHIVELSAFDRAFDNIARSLKDGGLLLFTDFFGAQEDLRLDDHVKVRCLDTYQQMLPEKGFELVAVHPLYNTLNKLHLPRLDNYLGRFFFLIDDHSKKIPRDNLSLSEWRYTKKTN